MRARTRWLAGTMLVAIAGCADDQPKISLSPSTTSLSLAQSGNSAVTLTVNRSHFTGPVSLTVLGAPAGVSTLVTPATLQNGSSTATLQVVVSGAAAPGDYTLTVKATGEGVADQTVDIALAVATTGSFAFSVLEPTVSVAQGGARSVTILIPRFNGNASDVSIGTSGLPSGVIAQINTTPTTVSSARLTFTVPAGVPTGTYSVALSASSPGFADQTTSTSLVVIAPPSTASLSMTFCPDNVPAWFAYRNEGYDWQVANAAGNVYTFDATDRLTIAFVHTQGSNQVDVFSLARAEAAASNDRDCAGSKSLTGTVAGLASGQTAEIIMGTQSATAGTNGAFSLTNVNARPLDIVAMRGTFSGNDFTPDRVIVRRSVDLANGGTIPALDFAGSESFAPASNTLTVTGTQSTDLIDLQNSFWSATSTYGPLQTLGLTTGSAALYSVPVAQQLAGDVHELYVDAYTQTQSAVVGHSYVEYYAGESDKTVPLGPLVSVPTISTVATAPYARLRGRADSQTDYNTSVRFGYFQQPTSGPLRFATIGVSAAYLGGTPAQWDVTIPDLSGVAGFTNSWMLQAGAPTQFFVEPFSGRTDLLFGAMPVQGDIVRFGYRVGLIFSSQLRAGALRAADTQLGRGLPQYLRR